MNNYDALNVFANELIGRIAGNEEQAMGCFFDSTLAFVYGQAISLTNNPEMAETVVTDTYLQVWQQARHYNITFGTPLGWLLQITHGRAIRLMRESFDGTTASPKSFLINGDLGELPSDGPTVVALSPSPV